MYGTWQFLKLSLNFAWKFQIIGTFHHSLNIQIEYSILQKDFM